MCLDEVVREMKHFNFIIYNTKDPDIRKFYESEKENTSRLYKTYLERRRQNIGRTKNRSISETLDLVGN